MSFQQYRPSGFNVLPPVVKNLLIINVIFYLATLSLGVGQQIDLTDILGLHYWNSEAFRPYQFITYMFMHGSFGHLFFNMLAVWMFGNAIENVWGPKRFLIYYLITGFGAALLHYALVSIDINPMLGYISDYMNEPSEAKLQTLISAKEFKITSYEMKMQLDTFIQEYNRLAASDIPAAQELAMQYLTDYRVAYLNMPNIVGASGALFGILLAFGMLFPNNIIYLYFAIPVKAKYFVALYGLIELFSGIQNDPTDNVAHFAHLGGMIFGFILIKYWNRNNNHTNQFY